MDSLSSLQRAGQWPPRTKTARHGPWSRRSGTNSYTPRLYARQMLVAASARREGVMAESATSAGDKAAAAATAGAATAGAAWAEQVVAPHARGLYAAAGGSAACSLPVRRNGR